MSQTICACTCFDFYCLAENHVKKRCRFGNRCGTKNCTFVHPANCPTQCKAYSCKYSHAETRCKNGGNCTDKKCYRIHPPICPFDSNSKSCTEFECPYKHTSSRNAPCRFGEKCENADCSKFLHPVTRVRRQCPLYQNCTYPLCDRDHPVSDLEVFLVDPSEHERLFEKFTKGGYSKLKWSIKIGKTFSIIGKINICIRVALQDFDTFRRSALEEGIIAQTNKFSFNPEEAEKARHIEKVKERQMEELKHQREAFCHSVLRTLKDVDSLFPAKVARLMILKDVARLQNKLPALAKRLELEEALSDETNQFLIVKGQTGSGKSTQLPQYIADMPQFFGKKVFLPTGQYYDNIEHLFRSFAHNLEKSRPCRWLNE